MNRILGIILMFAINVSVFSQRNDNAFIISLVVAAKFNSQYTFSKESFAHFIDNNLKKHLIRIVNENEIGTSYALPGDPVSNEDFRKWIEHAESTPTISLTQAKQQWQARKIKLQKRIR